MKKNKKETEKDLKKEEKVKEEKVKEKELKNDKKIEDKKEIKENSKENNKKNKEEKIVVEHKRSKVTTIILWIFVVIFTILFLGACGLWSYYSYNAYMSARKNYFDEMEVYKNTNILAFKNINESVEYLSTWNYQELVDKVVDKDRLIDGTRIEIYYNNEKIAEDSGMLFNVVGDINIEVHLIKPYVYQLVKTHTENIECTKTITINVKDTIFPKITGVSNKTITVGDTIDVKSGVSASDEREGEIELVVEGSVNTAKAGTYTIKFSATDRNGNKTTQEMKVTVNEKPKPKTTTKKKTTTSSKKTTTSSKKSSSSSSSKSSSSSSSSKAPSASTKSGRLSIAKSEAKKVAKQIFKSGMSDLQKAEAIAEWLFNNVDRQLNQSTEAYKTNFGNEAYAAFVLRKAACSGFCKAAMLLCTEGNLKCEHVNANKWTHQWLRVKINGEWLELDGQMGLVGDLY